MPWQTLLRPQARLAHKPLDEWFSNVLQRIEQLTPMQLAITGGCVAATPGFAFLAGYQAALRALWPAAPTSLGALCVTEQRSTRPADMQTRLDGLSLKGRKDFVTAAECAQWMLVAARVESGQSKPALALTVVHRGAVGVRVEPLPALPLMPEISHGRLYLQDAPCQILPGDGWADYCKPFRTLEDNYVLAAMVAWLHSVGLECAWPQPLQLRLVAILAGCSEVARHNPSSPIGHVLLAGLFSQLEGLRPDLTQAFNAVPNRWQTLWLRDQGLLSIASSARSKRLEKALASVQ